MNQMEYIEVDFLCSDAFPVTNPSVTCMTVRLIYYHPIISKQGKMQTHSLTHAYVLEASFSFCLVNSFMRLWLAQEEP